MTGTFARPWLRVRATGGRMSGGWRTDRRSVGWLALGVLLAILVPSAAAPQESAPAPDPIRVVLPGGEELALPVRTERGYRVLAASSLAVLGWEARTPDPEQTWRLRHAEGTEVALDPGDPFFRWNGTVQQLVDAPYLQGEELWVPAQVVLDFLPFHLPDYYRLARGTHGIELRMEEGPPAGEGGEGAGP